jgi:drug/metabolite transporter (DMT)-like permease
MSHEQQHNEHPDRLGRLRGSVLRQTGLLAVVFAAALWGLGGTLAGKLFEQGADPLEVVAVRTWITLAGLATLLFARKSPSARRERGPVPWRLVAGFGLSVSVANAGLFLAIQRLPVAVALVLQNLAPAFVVLSALVFTRRVPSARVLAGLVAALAGVACVVELPTTPLDKIDLPGLGFGLLTAAGIAAFSHFGSHATRACGALTANTWAFVVASAAWLLFQGYRGC